MRTERGLSQADLAGDKLSTGYISLLELGRRTPSHEVAQYLAVRLGCSSTELATGEPSERDQRLALEQAYAKLAIEHGESAEARRRLEPLLAEDGLPRHVRDDLCLLLGMACERSGDLGGALRAFRELMTRALVADTHLPVTVIGIGLLRCYLDGGDLHQAAVTGEQVLAAAEDQNLAGTDDYYRLAATVMAAHLGLGDWLSARLWVERYLAQAEADGGPAGQAALYWNAAVLAEHQGRLADALALCERALGLQSELETVRDTARLRLEMAWLLLLDSPPQVDRAGELLDRCADTLDDLGSRGDRARWKWLRATVLLLRGDARGSEVQARQALELLVNGGTLEQSQAQMALSDALVAQGRNAAAVEPLITAMACLDLGESARRTALSWRDLAERLLIVGHTDEAVHAFRCALDGAGIRDRTGVLTDRIRELADAAVVPEAAAARQGDQ
jgi:transcriptional regulator with XRE-family HTH domain